MKLGFIGAGKVGFSLGKFFAQGGVPVTGYYSRRRESAQEAAAFTAAKSYEKLENLVQDSDTLFITVPDGSIPQIFQQLRELNISGKQICHCSGALTAREAFPGIENTGAWGYSIHPLFPIHSKHASYRELPGAFFCLEGSGLHLSEWEQLLCSLGASVRMIPSDEKICYHAACVMASNLICALMQESLDLLHLCGFSYDAARRALAPLIQSNLEHLLKEGPVKALTGPVERGDSLTIEKHLDCFPSEEERELYRFASLKLLKIAKTKHPETNYLPVETVLKEGAYR